MKFPSWVPTVAAIALFGASFLFFIAAPRPEPAYDPDSFGYLQYADDIASGVFFRPQPGLEVPLQRATRTPGYPALLALTKFLPGAGGQAQPLVLHAVLALATLTAVTLLLRRAVSPFFSAGAVYLAQFLARDHYSFVMTEWLTLHLLLLLGALWAASGREKGSRWGVARGLVVSLAIVARPAVIVLGPLALLHQLLIDRSWRGLGRFTAALALPLLGWMLFNAATIHSFSITAFGGFSLFGVAASVGAAEAVASDSPEFAAFRTAANAAKRPPAGEEAQGVRPNLADAYAFYATCYDHNTWLVGRKYAETVRISYVDANRLMAEYARRTLRANPRRYAYYVAVSLREALRRQIPWTWPLLAVASLAALFILGTRGSPAPLWHLALACLGMGAVHAAHMLLCSATGFMLARYQIVSAGAWLTACLLLLGGGLKVASRRAWLTTTQRPPPGAATDAGPS